MVQVINNYSALSLGDNGSCCSFGCGGFIGGGGCGGGGDSGGGKSGSVDCNLGSDIDKSIIYTGVLTFAFVYQLQLFAVIVVACVLWPMWWC